MAFPHEQTKCCATCCKSKEEEHFTIPVCKLTNTPVPTWWCCDQHDAGEDDEDLDGRD